jgi:hypothetical protein
MFSETYANVVVIKEDKQMRSILFMAKVRTKVEVVQCQERVRELSGWLNSDLVSVPSGSNGLKGRQLIAPGPEKSQ